MSDNSRTAAIVRDDDGGVAACGPLKGIRVLELGGVFTSYCGKLFSDLGAEVVLIEPPTGSAQRHEPPFVDNIPGVENSLTYTYYNCGKKSVTLDIECCQGQDLFRQLTADADLLIESTQPGFLAARGVDYDRLAAINPGLVFTGITAFGQEGPYAHFAYSDLTLLALGGLLYLGGYPDSAPIRVYGNQALNATSMFAAVVSISAVYAAIMGSKGQFIDVSAQQCVALALESSAQILDLEGTVRKRYAGQQRQAGTGVFATLDGFVCVMASGISSPRFWSNTIKWLLDERVAGADALQQPEWAEIDYLGSEDAKRRFGEIFVPFAASRTSEYLYQGGQRHRLPICPVCSPSQVLKNRQLLARDYFVNVQHGESGRVLTMPGAPYKLHQSPWRLQGGAPRLGQHNIEILGRLGVTADEVQALAGAGTI